MRSYRIIIKCIEENRIVSDIRINSSPPIFKQLYLVLMKLYPVKQGYKIEINEINEAPIDICKMIAMKESRI